MSPCGCYKHSRGLKAGPGSFDSRPNALADSVGSPDSEGIAGHYPAISLKEAVEKVGKLYEKNTRFSVPITAAAEPMDYGPKSSSFIQAVATLKSYGLIDVTGTGDDRKVAVSERGQKIAVNHKDR